MDSYVEKLSLADLVREPVIRSAIETLRLPTGSRGLDVGCGTGSHTLMLADAVGPSGQVAGLDMNANCLKHARETAERSGRIEQVTFQEGNMYQLPFENDTFDWIWSADCVGYPWMGEILPLLKELSRVMKPGGRLAVLAWTSQQLLPGYQLLEARLNATSSIYIPHLKGKDTSRNFLRAPGWFAPAGFGNPEAHTFSGTVQAPLSDGIRRAMVSLFEMLWEEPQAGEDPGDRREYLRLCKPDSPDFILNLPEYYAFFTYSMFTANLFPPDAMN